MYQEACHSERDQPEFITQEAQHEKAQHEKITK